MDPIAAKIVPALLTLFVVWRVYLRFRRNIGRQPLKRPAIITRIVIFSAVSLFIAAGSLAYPRLLLGLGGGLLLGVPCALVGLHLTRFETTDAGHFYTPNTHIGLALSLLLVGRVAYRVVILYFAASHPDLQAADFMQSPLTLVTYGLTAGYYIAYYAGVLWHQHDKPAAVASQVPGPGNR